MSDNKLSIIVPVYNVEDYIRDCMLSIYRQGLSDEDFEVIIVNDGTKDRSMEMVEDLIQQHENITVINQENQGLSCSRNIGLLYSKGTYVLFVDSDDLIADGCLPLLLGMAISSSVDLLVADYLKLTDEDILKYERSSKEPVIELKTGSQLFLEDLNPRQSYVWRTFYRREFLLHNDLKFIPGICYEDIPFTPECYLRAQRCMRVNTVFYLYRMGHSSITSTMNEKKAMDLNKVIARLWELKDMKWLTKEERCRFLNNIFITFSFELWCISHNKNVFDKRKEIINDLLERVPDLKFTNGFKQILVSTLFRMIPNIYLKMRSL